MTTDFKATQVQTNKIIVTGSFANDGSNQLLIYNYAADDGGTPNQGVIDSTKFSTAGVGTDVLLYVSGGVGKRGVAGSNAISVFGGDLHVSGNLTVGGSSPGGGGGGGEQFWYSQQDGAVYTSGSALFRGPAGSNTSPADFGTDTFFYVSGSIGSKDTAVTGTAVFGGDVVISGTLHGGSPLRIGSGLQVTGTLDVKDGLSGSLTRLSDGSSYLVAGTNITITTASNGQVTIGSSGGGTNFWFERYLDQIYTTGSVEITGSLTQGSPGNIAGIQSHAEGAGTIAIGGASHAEGYLTEAGVQVGINIFGDYSHAEGSGTRAWGMGSHAEGDNTFAEGASCHAEGFYTTASDYFSHAEGQSTYAAGQASHAEGLRSYSQGQYSHAEGWLTTGTLDYSHAEGVRTIAGNPDTFSPQNSNIGMHAEGYYTNAYGNYSHAEGSGSFAIGDSSHSEGIVTIASGTGQLAIGKYNKRGNDFSLFVIGDGTGDLNANRSDIVRVNSGTLPGSGSFEVTGTIRSTLGFSGSLTQLTDGTPYLVAGSGIQTSTGSNGAVTISLAGTSGLATGKQYVAPYTTTTSTTTVLAGQFSWVPSDYTGLTSVRVRAIMSTDGTANHTGSLQIYNLTSGSYLDLVDTPAVSTFFEITSSIPTLLTSSNLLSGITNFNNSSTSIYEVRVSGSSANSTILGGVEIIFT